VFLWLLDDGCKRGDEPYGNHQGRARWHERLLRCVARWHERLLRCVQQMAVYLGDGEFAAEGCRGDMLCAAPEYFEDAIRESRRRREDGRT
jgi:hypothetical protein